MPEIENGTILQERYSVERRLGAGGTSTVYLAFDQILNRQVAMKFLHQWTTHLGTEIALRRFEREAQSLSQLLHPNIIRVYRFGVLDNKEAFLVMEFTQGESLRELLNRKKLLPCDEAVGIALQICAALEYAHSAQMVHRDLKPENVMVIETPSETLAKVLDFGLCKFIDQTDTGETMALTLTETGLLIGTAAYMSPEQGLGEVVDYRSDIYSFGCVLFEMITGTQPFNGDAPGAILLKHMSETVPLILALSPDCGLPQSLQDLIAKCMAKNKKDRYQNFGELGSDLLAIAQLNNTAVFVPRVKSAAALISVKTLLLTFLVLAFVLTGSLMFFANTDQGKLFQAGQIQASLSAAEATKKLLQMHRDMLSSHNLSAARKLLETSVNSHVYLSWPAEERTALLLGYIESYRAANLAGEAFETRMLFLEKTLDLVRHLQNHKRPPAGVTDALARVCRELYGESLTKKQWSAISQVFKSKADVFVILNTPSYLLWPGALRCVARSHSDPLQSEDARVELSKFYYYATYVALGSDNVELLFSMSKRGLELDRKYDFPYDEHLIRTSLCQYYLKEGRKDLARARAELAAIEKAVKNLQLSGAETESLNDLRARCGVGKIIALPPSDNDHDEDHPMILKMAGDKGGD